MQTSEVQSFLEEIVRLMELKGENPFKVRAFARAAESLASQTDLEKRAQEGTLTDLPGVGKGIAEALTDFLLHGKSPLIEELQASLPAGLEELIQVPGLGPKKARQLIDELDIHSLVDLEDACRENRLATLKGFGEKVVNKILEGISFLKAGQGLKRLDEALAMDVFFRQHLEGQGLGAFRILETGALRRKVETVGPLEYLVELPADPLEAAKVRGALERAVESFDLGSIHLEFSSSSHLGFAWARSTGTPEHWKAIGSPAPFEVATEERFYESLGLPWIAPEMRETGEEVAQARQGLLGKVLPWDGVRGIFHNHTVYSDGKATLEEMVLEAKRLGCEYIGISDHSQSAFYAQGLKPADLTKQEKEIRALQKKHPEIRIFWGIESDILAEGSLDYEPEVLRKFDFVIASIHSRFQMDREAMTERVLRAIRNPFTRFLGHMTGRILLGRKGFELDTEKVIAEAAAHDVAIEINAHPMRLDIDWRWGAELRKHSTSVSINPDAHEVAGVANTVFGIGVARKALLPTALVVNSRSVQEVEKWLLRK